MFISYEDRRSIAEGLPPPLGLPHGGVERWREAIAKVLFRSNATVDDAYWVASRGHLPSDDAIRALGPRRGFRIRNAMLGVHALREQQ